jgi:anti-sigma factor ChrR (cupin superfamily)
MKINTNLMQQVFETFDDLQWIDSPMQGVERKMLERNGSEMAAKVTSIVRYAKGSKFSSHVHTGGEEFLVLDGVFQDEHGDYPTGTYARNAVGTEHAPSAADGCMIFVKLGQYQTGDDDTFSINSLDQEYVKVAGRKHVESLLLHQFAHEQVAMERWGANKHISLENNGGIEILLIKGEFSHQQQSFSRHDWLRLPQGTALQVKAGADGCQVWIKTGHHIDQG